MKTEQLPTGGEFLRSLRQAVGQTQDDFASRLEASTSTVSLTENGARKMSFDMLVNVFRVLWLPPWILSFLDYFHDYFRGETPSIDSLLPKGIEVSKEVESELNVIYSEFVQLDNDVQNRLSTIHEQLIALVTAHPELIQTRKSQFESRKKKVDDLKLRIASQRAKRDKRTDGGTADKMGN